MHCYGDYGEKDWDYHYRVCIDCVGGTWCIALSQQRQRVWQNLAARVAAGELGGARDGLEKYGVSA